MELHDYAEFERPLPLPLFLRQYAEDVRADIESNKPFKYPFVLEQSGALKTVQGGYLTRCTPVLYQLLRKATPENGSTGDDDKPLNRRTNVRFWAIGAGEEGRLWNDFQERGVIAIGWDELGDLRQYSTRDAMADAIRTKYNRVAQPVMDSLACHQFAQEMKPGDFVIAKIGGRRLLGFGVVQSDYQFDPALIEYKNVRKVKWLRAASVELPDDLLITTKTLTDMSDYGSFVDFVRQSYVDDDTAEVTQEQSPPFVLEEAVRDLFLSTEQFLQIVACLRRKKNVILQGPPGVGKTYIARQLGYALMGFRDDNRIEMVQFHQSYSYEDFIQGFRPKAGGGFELRDGVFYQFCNRARLQRDRPHVFIIDEINRGNLSKVFGELMMLIEPDKRGPKYAIPLTYSEGPRFSVPENLYLVGLMNTADRSLAMVDYALRRRFTFFDLEPQFATDKFRAFLHAKGTGVGLIDRIVARMGKLNEKIASDQKNLGRGFRIGHSFFCGVADGEALDEAWYRVVIETEIAPLLREYWFDRPKLADELIAELFKP